MAEDNKEIEAQETPNANPDELAQETPEKAQEAPNVNLDELAQGKTETAQEAPQEAREAQEAPQEAREKAEAKPAEKDKQPAQAVGFAPDPSDDVYTAEEGETLLSIANKLKISLGKLKKRNSVKPLEKLRQYVKIHLPKE